MDLPDPIKVTPSMAPTTTAAVGMVQADNKSGKTANIASRFINPILGQPPALKENGSHRSLAVRQSIKEC
jgi:hypothetical protein